MILIFPLSISCGDEELEKNTENLEKHRFGDWELTKFDNHVPFNYGFPLFFVSEKVGYLTRHERIYKTIDSGNTWNKLDSVTHFLANDIQFLDENTGFISGYSVVGADPTWGIINGILLKTVDGGHKWSYINYPPRREFGGTNPEFLEDIFFFDKLNGLALIVDIQTDWDNIERRWFLAKTNDGGETWLNLNLYTNSSWKDIKVINNTVYIINSNNGIHKSDNKGETWNTFSLPMENIQRVFFYNQSIGYATNGFKIIKTNDGGVTWNFIEESFSNVSLINFTNENEGLVIDFQDDHNVYSRWRGIIMYQTVDGGQTWAKSDFIENFNFHNATFPNPNLGYSIFWSEFYKLKKVK